MTATAIDVSSALLALKEESMKRIRQYYRVPARRGMRVAVDGKPGRITSARGPYIMVRFDDCPSFSKPCHPTWNFDYGVTISDETGNGG